MVYKTQVSARKRPFDIAKFSEGSVDLFSLYENNCNIHFNQRYYKSYDTINSLKVNYLKITSEFEIEEQLIYAIDF